MLKFIENLAETAGKMALEERKHFSSDEIHFKNAKDLVTDVDRKVEQFIRGEIAAAYPDHGLFRGGRPYAGAVCVPRLGELYSAILGGGAFCNGKPIHVSPCGELANSLGITGFACLRAGLPKNNLPHFCRLAPLIRDIRRYGSAAYDLCSVAAGTADFFWEMELQPYDVAAGGIILTEAGGTITDFSGGPDYPRRGIVASNGTLHNAVLQQLALD